MPDDLTKLLNDLEVVEPKKQPTDNSAVMRNLPFIREHFAQETKKAQYEYKKPDVSAEGMIQTLTAPSATLNKGVEQALQGDALTGALNVGLGIAHTAFLPVSLPFAAATDVIKSTGKVLGIEDFTEPLAGAVNLPFEIPSAVVEGGQRLIDAGLEALGVDTKQVDEGIIADLQRRGILSVNATPEELAETMTEINKLALTILGLKGVHKGTVGLKGGKTVETPLLKTGKKLEVETVKKFATKKEIAKLKPRDKSGKFTKIEKKFEEKTGAKLPEEPTKLELKPQKTKPVKGLTQEKLPLELAKKEQTLDANKVAADRIVETDVDPALKPKSGINKIEDKYEIEISNKNIADINKKYNDAVDKKITVEELENFVSDIYPKLVSFKVRGLVNDIISDSTLLNIPKKEVKISKIKDEPVPNKTVENIKKAQEIVGKDEFTKIATKLSEGKETLLKQTFTEELANNIVKEGKLPKKYEKFKSEEIDPRTQNTYNHPKFKDKKFLATPEGQKALFYGDRYFEVNQDFAKKKVEPTQEKPKKKIAPIPESEIKGDYQNWLVDKIKTEVKDNNIVNSVKQEYSRILKEKGEIKAKAYLEELLQAQPKYKGQPAYKIKEAFETKQPTPKSGEKGQDLVGRKEYLKKSIQDEINYEKSRGNYSGYNVKRLSDAYNKELKSFEKTGEFSLFREEGYQLFKEKQNEKIKSPDKQTKGKVESVDVGEPVPRTELLAGERGRGRGDSPDIRLKEQPKPKSEVKGVDRIQQLKEEALGKEGAKKLGEIKPKKGELKTRTVVEKTKPKERKFTEEDYKNDVLLIRNKPTTAFADPQVLKAYTRAGAYHLENVIRSGVKKTVHYTEWSKSMIKDFGQKIKPHLLRIWSGIKKEFGKKIAQIVQSPLFPIKQTKLIGDDIAPRKFTFSSQETPKKTPKVPQKEGKTTGVKNEIVNRERRNRGLKPLKSEFVREWGEVGEDALNKIETGKVNPHKLAQDLVNSPRPHTDVEAAILSYEKLRIKEARSDINRRLAENPNEKLYKEALGLDELYHTNELASNLSGTEVARALNIRKMELQDDYSIAPLINRARVANNDNVIPQEVRTKLESSSREIERLNSKVNKLEEELTQKSAEEYVNELTVKEVSQRKQTKRRKSQESLDVEFDNLIKEFAESTQFNILVDPKQIKLMSLMTKNRVQKGVTSVNDIVNIIHESTKEYIDGLTKRDVMDAIGGYGKYTKLSKEEINVKLREIKRQARLLSSIDDVKTKQQKPLKSGVERDALSKRVKELQKQLKVEMDKLGLDRGLTEASLRKSYETRLKNRKFELEKMLRTGDFTKKPRRTVKMDNDLIDLKDKVDLLKSKVDTEIYLLEQANKSKYQKAKELFTDVVNVPKSVKSAFDLSAPFRQGAFVLLNHPIIGFGKGGAFREMFRYAVSDKFERQLKREINESPNLGLIKKSGLYLANLQSTLGRVLGKEEAFQSHIPEKIPVLKHGIKFSERGYVGFLDKLRFDVFNYKIEQLHRAGYTFKDRPDLFKATAKLINIGTGRGTLGGFERAARILSLGLFSPRLIASRLQLLTMPLTAYAKLPKELRVGAMLDMVRFVGVGTSIAMLAKLAGADVESNPTSSDFMKIRIGNTRIDPWAGLQQPFVLGARVQPFNKGVKSSTGKMMKLDGSEFPFATRWSYLMRFAESKMSPTAGMLRNLLKNETFMGEDLTAGNAANDLLMPLYLDDLYEAYKIDGAEGAIITAPGFFGVGTQTYEPKVSKKKKLKKKKSKKEKRK